MTIWAFYYIRNDFQTNKYIKNNPNSLLFVVFFSYSILANIINGNGFKMFNNIYFIIHSAVFFFLIMHENYRNNDYIKVLNFIILLITGTLSIISLLTILTFISNKTGLTNKISSEEFRTFIDGCAPVNRRWYTLLNNPNTFAHLVSMSFFLNIIPYKTLSKRIYKNLILLVQLINTMVLIMTGSRGAFIAILSGIITFFIYIIIKLYNNNRKKLFSFLLYSLFAFTILFLILRLFFKSEFSGILYTYIFRIGNTSNISGRANTWTNLLKLPFLSNLFGFNDDYLYHYLKNLNAFYPQGFLNNSGRAHNMYLEVLVSYGIIAFGFFISCIIKTFIQVRKSYCHIQKENKLLLYVLFIQFITILVGGIVEQLPIFNLSPHSLLFMFVWANLITLTTTKKIKE